MRHLRRRLLTGLALGFAVLIVLLLVADVQQLQAQVDSFSLGLVPAIVGATLFNYALRFVKWHYYLGQIGIQDLT